MQRGSARKILRRSLPLFFLVAGTLVAACGDDDDGGDGGGVTLDPAKADAIAHSAMLTVKDLPGTGWTLTETDEFDEAGLALGEGPACAKVEKKLDATNEKTDAARAGRAQAAFSNQGKDDLIPLDVEAEVNVFEETRTPADALKTFRSVLASDDFATCMKDLFATAGGGTSGIKVASKSVEPRLAAPADGSAKAFLVSISGSGFAVEMRLEMYLWRFGNVGTTVSLSGPDDGVTTELVKAAVGKMQAKLEAASKAK